MKRDRDTLGERPSGSKPKRFLVLLALLLIGLGALATLRIGPLPAIAIESELPGIGRSTPVRATFQESVRGLGDLRLELVQGDRVELIAERRHSPRPPWAFWGARTESDVLEAEVGSATIEGLTTGEAVLRATATRAGTWIRHPEPVVEELTLPVRLVPPSLSVLSSQHYPTQGGAEVVVYRVGESSVRDGVQAGDFWFPGFPLPGGDGGQRFALFGVPFDLTDPSNLRLVAEDDVGNRATVAFVDRFFPKAYSTDDIQVGDAFLAKVVPEILANTPGAPKQETQLDDYLYINRELRRQNAAALVELAADSQEEFHWQSAFLPMPNAQVMSAFADRRTYFYEGREIDRQDHLGFDLASVRHAPLPAANRGRVVLARYLGIYGNAVVIDHGFGLMTLYGHLSSIDVEEGQMVERGQAVGRSGQTGLAGGDHLHFTVLLQGMAVNPIEWWDSGWIRDRLDRKLGAALPFTE